MKNLATVIGLLLYSSDPQFVEAANINVEDLVQTSEQAQITKKSHKKHHELEHLMTSKFKELEERIKSESQTVEHLQNSLQQAKIELETDQTMLMSNKKFLEKEKQDLEQLDKSIGVRAQLADKVSLKKQKQAKLREAAERLVKHENEVRKQIQDEIIARLRKEQEEARKLGQIESKDDPELRRLAKLEAIRKAEEEEIAEDANEINSLTKHLKKNPNKKHKKVAQVYDEVYGDDGIQKLDKRAAKAKKLVAKKRKVQKEDTQDDRGSTAVLDDDAPIASAPEPKPRTHARHEEVSSRMSADDTDNESSSTKSGVALTHKKKEVGIDTIAEKNEDKRMENKDKASQQMKKEFKKQMDLTKNIGQEEEPKPKQLPKKKVPVVQKSVAQKKKPSSEPIADEGATEKQWDVKKTEEKKIEKPAEKKAEEKNNQTEKKTEEKKPVAEKKTPVEGKQTEQKPAEEKSEDKSAEKKSQEKPAEEKPAEEKQAEKKSEVKPKEEKPKEEKPVEEKPEEKISEDKSAEKKSQEKPVEKKTEEKPAPEEKPSEAEEPKLAEEKPAQKPQEEQADIPSPSEEQKEETKPAEVKSAVKSHSQQQSKKPHADRGVEEKLSDEPKPPASASDETKPEAKPEVKPKPQSIAQQKSKVEQGTGKLDTASFKELEEMSTFSQEEDKAIEAQFDGEELVKAIGGLAGKSISKDIKHANPRWVTDKSSKWGKAKFKTEAEAAADAKKEAEAAAEEEAKKDEKKDEKKEEKKEEEKKALAEEAKFVEEM